MAKEQTKGGVAKAKRGASDLFEALQATRALIEELASERQSLECAPVSSDEAITRIKDWKRGLSERSALRDLANRFMQRSLRLPSQPVDLDVIGAVCLGQLESSLIDLVSEISADGEGLSQGDREAKLKGINEELLRLELEEESVIRSAERLGLDVLRRAKADPRAVLAHDEVLP